MRIFRHDDLKTMLDSSKDNLKLDAMKRMIGVSGAKKTWGGGGGGLETNGAVLFFIIPFLSEDQLVRNL